MATVAGTTLTYGVGSAGGNREDLADKIYDLYPDDTYFLTNLEKTKVSPSHSCSVADAFVFSRFVKKYVSSG